ncbi:hypothetical protein AGMMS49546_22410 [Spirochaetia bacterium]|nr:hypothetical protein AGMMS49546_22410 [Spirochaetia bacterium]
MPSYVEQKKRHYDAAKTPFQRLPEQPFEDVLEGIQVKQDALKLRDAMPIVEQRDLVTKAVDHLLSLYIFLLFLKLLNVEDSKYRKTISFLSISLFLHYIY